MGKFTILELVQNIHQKIGNREDFVKWFEETLDLKEIYLISDLRDIKEFYTNYMKRWDLTPTEYRAMAFSGSCIILHENNETLDSMSWLLLHELGHRFCDKLTKLLGYDLIVAMSGGTLSSLSNEEYKLYMTNDIVHEARYEEQFVNEIATKIMGFAYDRHWWRANCYSNVKQ